jgi:carnitine 3-dehydrogenase
VTVVGAGVIGAGWVARFVLNGVDVTVCDPHPDASRGVRRQLDNARLAWSELGILPEREGAVRHEPDLADAVADAIWVTEAVPERLELKREVYAAIERAAPPEAVIASSTSGLLPSELQAALTHPQRFLVAHPFNPVYLLPLVELVGGRHTEAAVLDRAAGFLTALGMHPLRVRKEIDAFIADRLLEAVWRESLWLVRDGVATTAEIDDAIRYGFGLRWAQMGVFDTYRLGGGEAGMRHFLEQFGPSLRWPWTRLTDVPDLDDALVERIAEQSDAQSGHLDFRELEQHRDANLVAILRALEAQQWGAGRTLAEFRGPGPEETGD